MSANTHITKPEKGPLPISVKGALAQHKPKLLSITALIKIFGKLVACEMQEHGMELSLCNHQAIFVSDQTHSQIDLSSDLSDAAKVQMVKDAVNYLNPSVPTPKKLPASKTKGKKVVKPKILGVDMAHDEIAAEVGNGGITSLPKAKTFYDPVTSSSQGSRYVYLAKQKDGTAKLAVRFKGTAVSVRIEPFNNDLQLLADVLGLSNNGTYASGHFQAESINLVRYMNLIAGSLEGKWEVTKFNEKKIREIGA